MLHKRSYSGEDVLFWLVLIPLCLSIGSFLFLNSSIIGYIEERHNNKIYVNTTCFLNGTITFNEPCKDDICWWPISSGLCPSTFRLCLKTIYVIIYGNNRKAFTDTRPSWAVSGNKYFSIVLINLFVCRMMMKRIQYVIMIKQNLEFSDGKNRKQNNFK